MNFLNHYGYLWLAEKLFQIFTDLFLQLFWRQTARLNVIQQRYTDFAVGPHSDFVGQIRLMPDRDRKDVFRTYRELFGRFRLSNRQASIFRVPISGPETILGNGLRHGRGSKYA